MYQPLVQMLLPFDKDRRRSRLLPAVPMTREEVEADNLSFFDALVEGKPPAAELHQEDHTEIEPVPWD